MQCTNKVIHVKMKKLVVVSLFLLAAVSAFAKNDWKGKVVDQNGEPVPYANVAVLSRADSTVVCGACRRHDYNSV